MASELAVKQYLALWLQVGKTISSLQGEVLALPSSIRQGKHYSWEFEQCWRALLRCPYRYYLTGTDLTFEQLLSSTWELNPCPRCVMPVPIGHGPPTEHNLCPCADLCSWPNNELPQPRLPVDEVPLMQALRRRLETAG
ncbi:MAG: hypothetical protein Fur0042_05720 [Cyanophyceae cyanobacterium]